MREGVERFVLSLGDTIAVSLKLLKEFHEKIDCLVTSPPYVYAQSIFVQQNSIFIG